METKRFKVEFEFETSIFSFDSGVETAFKELFPEWKNIKAKRIDE